jgi:hypothetical protein
MGRGLSGSFSGQQIALTLEVGGIPSAYGPQEDPQAQANAQQTAQK